MAKTFDEWWKSDSTDEYDRAEDQFKLAIGKQMLPIGATKELFRVVWNEAQAAIKEAEGETWQDRNSKLWLCEENIPIVESIDQDTLYH